MDFFDVKAEVEALCHPGVPVFKAAQHRALHPGQSAQVWLHGEPIGWLGAMHPQWQQKHDVPGDTVLFELDLASLHQRSLPAFTLGDDGTLTMTSGGKAAPLGKFDGAGSAKRAVVLATAFVLAPPAAPAAAPAGKPAAGAKPAAKPAAKK